MSRLGHSQALLGPELYKKIRETPVLVVGAGGIGCELCRLDLMSLRGEERAVY